MNYPEAQTLARKAYCSACPGKTPIIRDTRTAERYAVVCPIDAGHPLSIAKSQFRRLYERWRQGERLFSLDGLLFSNSLTVMARKDPDRWEYREDETGNVIRIGQEWWPGYVPKEEEMTSQALVEYTPQQLDIIRNELAVGKLNDQEFRLFLAVCKRTGLDPFARQIYAIKYEGKNPRMAIITGIDGYRLTAQRTDAYAGSDEPEFSTQLVAGQYPEWARVTVYKIVQGQRVGFTGTARWTEFSKNIDSGEGAQWKKQPYNMLAKCAEAQALRKGFPMETMELTFQAEAVPIAPDTRVHTETGEIIEGSYTRLEGPQYMITCPLHAFRWQEQKGKNGKFWSHPTDDKDPQTGKTQWCNRRTALRTVLNDSLEDSGVSPDALEIWIKEQWGVTKAGLSEEQACGAIEYLRSLTDAKAQEDATGTADSEDEPF